MLYRSLGAAVAVLALLSAPAMAQNIPNGLVGTNVTNSMNLAAGIGNTAKQKTTSLQASPFGSLVNTNVANSTNVAAGIGNTAKQKTTGIQGNGVHVGLNFTGRGPLVSTDVSTAANVAAGLGNVAQQRNLGVQR
ncbi:hypothetical protein [Azospirillum canadense]|uniref:hypothetical protein n=1 Tax=Azospirillum canadense TaxID=403962 RepID=UPI002225BC03|nr:hypothetical protein [Azospirillum canadense]MCW2240867.1 hypothetical protein [Azospirillum canadense]